ncbi:MAG TPA: hypothetical protein VM933_03725 [Acidimicrobiales bacterium]|nr:hypothetical protein [Acidimicrobiales bacterium]
MKRRLVTIAAIAAALMAGTSAAQALDAAQTSSHWGCVAVEVVDEGVCLSNPLPDRLPLSP